MMYPKSLWHVQGTCVGCQVMGSPVSTRNGHAKRRHLTTTSNHTSLDSRLPLSLTSGNPVETIVSSKQRCARDILAEVTILSRF